MTWTSKEKGVEIVQSDIPVVYQSTNYAKIVDGTGVECTNYVKVQISHCTEYTKNAPPKITRTHVFVYRIEGNCKKLLSQFKFDGVASHNNPEITKAVEEAKAFSPLEASKKFNAYVKGKLANLPEIFDTDQDYYTWCEENGVKAIDPRSYGAKYWSGGLAEYSAEDTVKFLAVRPRVKGIEREEINDLDVPEDSRSCSKCSDPYPRFTTLVGGNICDDCL